MEGSGANRPRRPSPLAAKLRRPDASGSLLRERLVERLRRSDGGPVTWVHSPAGSGKTLLLASYLAQPNAAPAIWYAVDPSDRDVGGLFHHLPQAAAMLNDEAVTLPVFEAGAALGLKAFARRFFAAFFAALPQDVRVVFDDYQEAEDEPAWNLVFRELLLARPQEARIFVASRQAPPAVLARFRAADELRVLAFDELRFDEREIEALLQQRRCDTGGSSQLLRRTRGWAMAVSLLARSLPSARAPESASAIPVHQAMDSVFDFLASEILEQLPVPTREALFELALLPTFDISMAAQLTERDVESLILGLEREHLLIERHADQFRLHDLFRQFLRARARHSQPLERQRMLLSTAARLLGARGQIDAASALLAEAEDWTGLSRLIESCAPELAAQGRVAQIQMAIHRLPLELRSARPWLRVWSALASLGRSSQAQTLAESAFADLRDVGDAAGMSLSWAIAVQAIVLTGESFDDLVPWMDARSALLPLHPANGIATQLALAELQAWPMVRAVATREDIARALDQVRLHGTTREKVQAFGAAAILQLFLGDHVLATDSRHTAAQYVVVSDPLSRLIYLQGEIYLDWIQGAFGTVEARVQEVLATSSAEGIVAFTGNAVGVGVSVALARRDVARAEQLFDIMRVSLQSGMQRGFYVCLRVWQALEAADLSAAERWMLEHDRVATELGWDFGLLQVALSRLAKATSLGSRESMEQCIAAVDGFLANVRWPLWEANAGLVKIHARLTLGTATDEELRATLSKARNVGLIGAIFVGSRLVKAVATAALQREIEVDYVARLVNGLEVTPPEEAALLPEWPWPLRVKLLGSVQIQTMSGRLELGRKLPELPLALLKLLAAATTDVLAPKVAAALWPGHGDRWRGSLDTAVYRLRRLLGNDEMIQHVHGKLRLAHHLCWTDVRALGLTCDRISVLASAEQPVPSRVIAKYRNSLERLYGGALAEAGDPIALLRIAERLRKRVDAALEQLAHLEARAS